MQEEAAEDLRLFMARKGYSQSITAEKANVSQATVSRALRGRPERSGRARKKLFTFIHKQRVPQGHAVSVVVAAFNKIWDGSEVHAEAVAKVIHAMDGLAPDKRGQE